MSSQTHPLRSQLPSGACVVCGAMLPISATDIRQIRTAVNWYLWKGAVFRVSLATIQRAKLEGGLSLTDIAAKSRALLFYRLNMQGRMDGTITADWMGRWDLLSKSANPPDMRRIPSYLVYIRQYELDLAIHPAARWRRDAAVLQETDKIYDGQTTMRHCGPPADAGDQPMAQDQLVAGMKKHTTDAGRGNSENTMVSADT
jgi:hypothetical protein